MLKLLKFGKGWVQTNGILCHRAKRPSANVPLL